MKLVYSMPVLYVCLMCEIADSCTSHNPTAYDHSTSILFICTLCKKYYGFGFTKFNDARIFYVAKSGRVCTIVYVVHASGMVSGAFQRDMSLYLIL